MRHTLLIPLVGPMQAWGSRSRFDHRDTHPEPTKSGVIGLVCAALGRPRSHDVSDLARLRFGVRIDSPGEISSDFHTAQQVLRADGSGVATAVTSERYYLADAAFVAGLEGSDQDLGLLQAIEQSLRSPVWTLALGRKSCPLSVPPYLPEAGGGSLRQGLSLEDALSREPWRPLRLPRPWDAPPASLGVVLERVDGSATQDDQPLAFDARRYGLRRVAFAQVDRPKETVPWTT